MEFCGFLRERVDCPVDVCVVVFVKIGYGFDNLLRFLRCGSVVEVDERVVVYFSF